MSTMTEVLTALLAADTTLTAILTGGVYAEDTVGRNGLSAQAQPTAFNTSTGFLKPCAVLQQRSENPWGGGNDQQAQYSSLRAMVEIYLRDDGAKRYTTLEAAALRIQTDLNNKFIAGVGSLKITYNYKDRDSLMNNALLIRLDYQAVFGRQLT